jgi:cell growth-regulating nucleolar protein
MVTFVCEVCNETLKKSAVINHSCRAGVTCVDCSKTFDRSSYSLHTSCVTEAEKYKHFGSSSGDRKEKKIKRDPQAEWTELIAKASSIHTSGRLMNILKQLTSYTNVPRKVKPFINFAKNSLKQHNETLLQDVYNAIQALLPPRPPQGVSLLVSEEAEVVEKEVATKDDDEKGSMDDEKEEAKPSRKRQRDVTSEPKEVLVVDVEEKNVDEDKELEEGGGLPVKKKRVTMKKLILTTLKLTEEKMKTKRLRKTCVEQAVQGSTASDIESAKGMFDAKLKMLINLGKVVESSDGKFVKVPLKDELYPSVE